MTKNRNYVGYACLFVTSIGWGLNWPGMKILLQEWPPLFSQGLAGTLAAILLFAIARHRGERLTITSKVLPWVLFGSFTNVFAWMGFTTVAMAHRWRGISGCLLHAAVGDAPRVADRGHKALGTGCLRLGLGLTGTGILLGREGFQIGPEKLLGSGLALAAALLFALETSRTAEMPRFRLSRWSPCRWDWHVLP